MRARPRMGAEMKPQANDSASDATFRSHLLWFIAAIAWALLGVMGAIDGIVNGHTLPILPGLLSIFLATYAARRELIKMREHRGH